MSVKSSKFPANYSSAKWKSFCFSVLAAALCASSAWAQAPSLVFDAQETLGFGYKQPQSIVVSSNGTVFIADTGNNRIIALDTFQPNTGVNNIVSTAPFTLNSPAALALDAHGNLFVGDAPTTGGRIIELVGDGNGNLTGAANAVFSGAPLTNPVSLTFDSAGTLFIGDYPTTHSGAIYSLASGAPAPVLLAFTGLPAKFNPAALLRDSSTNLLIADKGTTVSSLGGIYTAPATGGAAQPIATQAFVIKQPSGLTRDAAGNLYVLTQLGTGTGFNAGQQVLIIPAASPLTPYILPNNGINSSDDMAFDPSGNLDVLDTVDGAVLQLSSPNPVNLGNVFLAGPHGTQVQFNIEFNAPTTLNGFRVVTAGDVSAEITKDNGGTCVNGNHTTLGLGGPSISAYFPYNCKEYFYGNPTYPGIRSSAIQVKGSGNTILASLPVWQTGFAGVEVTYPLNSTVTAINLQQPQAIAISGLNKKVYVADTTASLVYSLAGLGGKTLTPVSTGTIALSSPIALALDGAGDLFIADFDNADVIKVPTTTGLAPSVLNTGGLLQHPIAMAFDYLGNLYIGDAGPGGFDADTGNPGFVVKIPAGGAAFKMTIPSVAIVYPQALATDPYTAALLIGDGGDPSSVGQVVQVSADGTSAGTGPVRGVTNPAGLVFDQADNLYILDGTANTITAVAGPQLPDDQYLVEFDNTKLSGASAIAASAGSQSFIVTGIGNNSLILLNGNASTLAFGTVSSGSQVQTAFEYNIGNLDLTLKNPYFTTNGTNTAFSVLPSSSCGEGLVLAPSIFCTINVQFAPQFAGFTNQQIQVGSDAYNGNTFNVPVLTVQGTGGNNLIKKKKK